MKKFTILLMLTLFAFAGSTLVAPPAAVAAGISKKANAKKPTKANNAAAKVEALFKKLDVNNDGKLSKDEFAKIASERKKNKKTTAPLAFVVKKGATKKGASKLDAVFTRFDANQDGFLSLDEFKKYAAAKAAQKKNKK